MAIFKQPIRNNISPLRMQQTFKSNTEISQKVISTDKEALFPFCPFNIILGAVNTTMSGYVGNNAIINNYTDFQKVFNGREPIIAEWDNSNTMKQVKGDPKTDPNWKDNQYWEKTFKVGSTYWGMLEQDSGGISKGSTMNFTSINGVKSIVLTMSANIDENKSFFESITNKLFSLWVLPKINIYDLPNIITQPQTIFNQEDREFYQISNIDIVYQVGTKDPVWATITFHSLNDTLNQTGLAINQYVQLGGPGEPVAFPYWNDTDRQVELDLELMSTKNGITHTQITYFGTAAISSILMMGRKITDQTLTQDANKNWVYRIDAPRIIAPYKFQPSIYDELHFTSIPEPNYFSIVSAVPEIVESLPDWKQNIESYYNTFAGEIARYEGILKADDSKTQATNTTNGPTGTYLPYWDDAFLISLGWSDDSYNTKISPYFKMNPHIYDPSVFPNTTPDLGQDTYKPSDTNTKSLGAWMFLNGMIMAPFRQLPETILQTTPFSIDQTPVIGGFTNFFNLGFLVGWSDNTQESPTIPSIPLLVSCGSYLVGQSVVASSSTIKGSTLLDLFKSGTQDTPSGLYGATTKTSALCFNLTDTIALKPTKISDGTLQTNPKTISTRELGQIGDSSPTSKNDEVYLIEKDFQLQAPLNIDKGYIIDQVITHAIAKMPYKLSFYSKIGNQNSSATIKDMVWQGSFNTLPVMTDNIRQWQMSMNLSNPIYPEGTAFDYPKNTPPVVPSGKTWSQTITTNQLLQKSTPNQGGDQGFWNPIDGSISLGTYSIPQIPDYDLSNIEIILDNNVYGGTTPMVWLGGVYDNIVFCPLKELNYGTSLDVKLTSSNNTYTNTQQHTYSFGTDINQLYNAPDGNPYDGTTTGFYVSPANTDASISSIFTISLNNNIVEFVLRIINQGSFAADALGPQAITNKNYTTQIKIASIIANYVEKTPPKQGE